MITKEKFKEWDKIFWERFVETDPSKGGYCIPVEYKDPKTGGYRVGDGTINLALLMTYLSLFKNEKENPITISNCLETIHRLEDKARNYYAEKFPFLFETISTYSGFFVRDDYDTEVSNGNSWSSWKMLHSLDEEDPCHSPFVSQDQVWNLNAILSYLMMNSNNSDIAEEAREIGYDLNAFIILNRFKVVNPYLSGILHFFTYLPSMNENKVKPWERQQDREDHFKPNIKVKRGANNWYYSGGTVAALDTFIRMHRSYRFNLRTLLYKGIVFCLDRIVDPIYRIFNYDGFKHNSYYCYAATSGIWYCDFKKHFLKKVEKEAKKRGTIFEPNLIPLILDPSELSEECRNVFLKYFDMYDSNPEESSNSPLTFLILYKWFYDC